MKVSSTIKSIAQALVRKKEKLGLAESCTGGLVSAFITSFPGATKFYQGAIVSYADEIKHDLLGVPAKELRGFGSVSGQVALKMARGALKALRCDWALSVTGVAGPTGGTKRKPRGLVFYAVAGPQIAVVKRKVFSGNRRLVQKKAAKKSLELLEELLKQRAVHEK